MHQILHLCLAILAALPVLGMAAPALRPTLRPDRPPTPLSFALIADKLGISRDAAKIRAERAYKRLGVHTRADAVQRARTLRVLP